MPVSRAIFTGFRHCRILLVPSGVDCALFAASRVIGVAELLVPFDGPPDV